MVTLREAASETTPKIANDATKSVFAWSPHNHQPRLVWLRIQDASGYPGLLVKRGTGAGGEGTCSLSGAGEHMAFGIIEFDPTQIANCNTAYAQYDLVPVIPLIGNEGVICRNLRITDPNAAIPADTPFIGGASGVGVVSDHSIDTVYYRSLTYIADASNPTKLVGYIWVQKNWADA